MLTGHPGLDHALKGGVFKGEVILVIADEWELLHAFLDKFLILQRFSIGPVGLLSASDLPLDRSHAFAMPFLGCRPTSLESAFKLAQTLLDKQICKCLLLEDPRLFLLEKEQKSNFFEDNHTLHKSFLIEYIKTITQTAQKRQSVVFVLQKIRAPIGMMVRPELKAYVSRCVRLTGFHKRIIYSLQ